MGPLMASNKYCAGTLKTVPDNIYKNRNSSFGLHMKSSES